MADWSAIRILAREQRTEIDGELRLRAAADVVEAATASAGVSAWAVPADDHLLAGAQAVLDRENWAIYYASGQPASTTQFNIAHELAHWWLHDEAASCAGGDITEDADAEPLPFGEAYISGYSPAQRREVEANIFAAELLLPAPMLRELFTSTDPPNDAASLANATGLSDTVILSQLAYALLTPNAEHQTPNANRPTPNALDASQQEAAEAAGPALISAGPGTGKTRTLIARIEYLLGSGVPPERILALTFSNKAAEEMRERLAARAPDAARRTWIGTFHAFGLELLRRYGDRLGLPPKPRLLDTMDAVERLEQNLARLPLREYEYLHDPTFPFRALLGAISRAKDELVTPARFAELAEAMRSDPGDEKAIRQAARCAEIGALYAVWQQILAEEGALDFGDLLFRAVEMLEAHPDVREEVRRQYPQVLVDEYQDINRASAMLVKLVAGDGAGFWAVGDLRQAIYRFRGASPANLTAFERDYPGGQRLALGVNYRSRPAILELFAAAAERMTGPGEPAGWRASREAGALEVAVVEAGDVAGQAEGIAAEARRLEETGIPLREQCVLCRTNSQADAVASGLERCGVPALFLGDLLAREEVRDLLALMALAAGDSSAIVRVARVAEYQLEPPVVYAVLASEAQALDALAESPDSRARALAEHLKPIAYAPTPWLFLARYLFGSAGMLRALLFEKSVKARQARIAIGQLLQLARSYEARAARGTTQRPENPLRAFLEHVRRLAASGEDTRIRLPAGADGIEGVRILTVHASKGLEFPVVYLPDLAAGRFPPRGRGSMAPIPPGLAEVDDSEEEEEERLFFVALSRARERLVLIRPLAASGRDLKPSPLLGLIEPHLSAAAIERCAWPLGAAEAEAALHTAAEFTPPGILSAQALEQYQTCPRRFYYARAMKLQNRAEPSAFSRYQEALWNTLRGVQEGTSAVEPTALLEEEWAKCGPAGHPYEPLLRERAHAMVVAAAEAVGGKAEYLARLEGGAVAIAVDSVAELPDGSLRLERWDTGRAKGDDHTDARLALMRAAAEANVGQPVSLAIRYLQTGEVREVKPSPRFEPARVAKYQAALAGIRAGRFPAQPGENCPRCPFYFICPA